MEDSVKEVEGFYRGYNSGGKIGTLCYVESPEVTQDFYEVDLPDDSTLDSGENSSDGEVHEPVAKVLIRSNNNTHPTVNVDDPEDQR